MTNLSLVNPGNQELIQALGELTEHLTGPPNYRLIDEFISYLDAEADIAAIPAPKRADEIQTICDTANSIVVLDVASIERGGKSLVALKKLKKEVTAHWKPYKDVANEIKDALMVRVNGHLNPIEQAEKRLAKDLLDCQNRLKREAEAERKRLDAEEQQRADEQSVSAMPWEEPAPAAPMVRPTPMFAAPKIQGLSTRKAPPKGIVANKRAFLEHALKEGNEYLLEYITVDQVWLNNEAKIRMQTIEDAYPGIKFSQEDSLAGR